ncbi:Probable amidase At4g34880 [Linum perenne]
MANNGGARRAIAHLLLLSAAFLTVAATSHFQFEEATVDQIQLAFSNNTLTSKQLVNFYLDRIHDLNPILRGVLELNPDAIRQAEEADSERLNTNRKLGDLHGVPILLKDGIATKDRMNTTCGSYALLGSTAARDAGVVEKLRNAGAVILGKATQSEWYHVRSFQIPNGWSPRGGQAVNPYVEGGDPCGSSSGSAISVAANMVAVSLGTETDGSILCPADYNSVVGIKPTVSLTSRAGVIPVSPRQDTIGPICRTVSDAVYVLDAIVGFDPRDCEATNEAAKFIPSGGYKQFLKKDGLKGKKIGIVRNPFMNKVNDSTVLTTFNRHLEMFIQQGATVIDDLEIANVDMILDPFRSGEVAVMMAEFKVAVNRYLEDLVESPVRSLAEIVAFNVDNSKLVCLSERMEEFGQELLVAAEMTNGIGKNETEAIRLMDELSREGFEAVMKQHELDAMVTIGSDVSSVLAIGGYPAISVPAGYDEQGKPFGIVFGGLKGTESSLIEASYAFEQATKARQAPVEFSLHLNRKISRYAL